MAPKILFIDIETAPIKAYTWGMYDQNIAPSQVIEGAYMLCWAAKWMGSEKVMYDSIFNHKTEFKRNPKNDSSIAKTIWPLMDEADIIIAHNGDDFDIKWLNTVFLRNKLFPVSGYKTVDTCKAARSHFRLGSNKLDEMAKVLGIGQKLEHEGFPLWIKCMRGDRSSWKRMEEYNKHDVFLLEQVYRKIRPFIKNHPNLALYSDDIIPICPNCGSKGSLYKRGYAFTYVGRYQRYVCRKCGKWTKGRKNTLSKDKISTILNPI